MIKKFSIALIGVAVLAMSFSMIQNWNIAESHKIAFKIKSAMGMVDGTIGGLKGTVSFDAADPARSSMNVTLDLATVTTGNAKRDKDIKEEDTWFDIAKYPKIAFKSNSVSKTAAGYTVDGQLTIKGTEKKVQIPFTFVDAATGGTFVGALKLNRLDYKVGKSSVMVKDTVEVTIKVPVRK
jgi:polyisoprenoid-binding protein YceI